MRAALASTALAVSLAAAAAGCTGKVRETTTSRSSEEQLLVSSSAERAVAAVDMRVLSGRKVFIDDARLESVDRGYVTSAFFDLCSEAGARLVRTREESDVVIEVRSACVGIYDAHWSIGIPGLYIMGLVDPSLAAEAGGGTTGSSSGTGASSGTSASKGAAGSKGTNAAGRASQSPSSATSGSAGHPSTSGSMSGSGGGGGVSTAPDAPGAARPEMPFTGGSRSSGNAGGASVESGGPAPAAPSTAPSSRTSGVVHGGEPVERSPLWTGKPAPTKGELGGGGAPTGTKGPAGGQDPMFLEFGYELREGWARIECFAYERETGVYLFGRHAWGYAHRGFFEDLHPPQTLMETAKEYVK